MTVYADILRYRELFANLFRRDFQAKYKGSALGVLWSLLNPLALMAVYLFFVYAISRPFGAAAQAGFGIGMRVIQAGFMPVVALGLEAYAGPAA